MSIFADGRPREHELARPVALAEQRREVLGDDRLELRRRDTIPASTIGTKRGVACSYTSTAGFSSLIALK